jgi:uncharacterized protein (TIGR03067 family)
MKTRIWRAAIGGVVISACVALWFLSASINGDPPGTASAADTAGGSVNSAAKTDSEQFTGTWLADDATYYSHCRLSDVWLAQLKINNGQCAISKCFDLPTDLTGRFTLDTAANLKTIDLQLDEFDLSQVWGTPIKMAAGLRRGVYEVAGDRLTICLNPEVDGPRPTILSGGNEKLITLTLRKAPAAFDKYAETIDVTVVDREGKPVAGANICTLITFSYLGPDPDKPGSKPEWRYFPTIKTDANGTASIKYDELTGRCLIARDTVRKQMAIVAVSPASLASGKVRLTLVPECHVSGLLQCQQLADLGKPIGWANVYAEYLGRRLALSKADAGSFQFFLPPGDYSFDAYGSNLKRKITKITVSQEQNEYSPASFAMTASNLPLLEGHPAPELEGVVGWKGEPVTLASLKGQYVLLEFWGYWCGPCMQSMPTLFALHDKFHDRGLAIVGVHVDEDGDVTNAAQLDKMLAQTKEQIWKGRDLPFPVALTAGTSADDGEGRYRTGVAQQYGIFGFPTTVLIDRQGNVVEQFEQARDLDAATKEIEKLLAEKP